MSRPAKLLKFPAVTGYLIAGILIGPYFLGRLGIEGLGFVSGEDVKAYSLFSQAALGFIAFSIGSEFRLSHLKKTGKKAIIIGFAEALTASLLVDIVLIGLHVILGEERLPLSVAITLGAIASATAPAATLMVVRQYKAHGKVTDMLLPIVALDDAIALMCFAVSFGIAQSITSGSVDVVSVVIEPIVEIVLSLVLGAVLSLIFGQIEKLFASNSKRLSLTIAFIILTVALSMLEFQIGPMKISFSLLLVCMMLGTVFCNTCDFSDELMQRADRWTAPLLVLFFVLSGAELEFSVFQSASVVLIGLTFVVTRSCGKMLGAWAGSKLTKCDPVICKYLGITLLPQAGVALGMSQQAVALGEAGHLIRNIVLFGVLIYELIGPFLTRVALTKSGDITPTPSSSRANPPGGHRTSGTPS